ncbi:MAG TPA: hypothetical protein VIG51_10775 [Candidatus Baltobacteraceae bacterium]|jgi:hypothetical protein
MEPLRVRVTQLGTGYVAESYAPAITGLGSSPEEAAENARIKALAVFDAFARESQPATLIVRIDEPGRSAIAMQPMEKRFSLDLAGKQAGSYYFDSEGNAFAPAGS